MRISDVSISRPVFASMISLALELFGALGYQRLTVREIPDLDPPVISVTTTLLGANPPVMESSVSDVLEEELSTLQGLRTITSSSAAAAWGWVVIDDKATRREVELGVRMPGDVEGRKGIDPDDRVAIGGEDRLFEGAPVKPTDANRRPQRIEKP